MATKDNPGRFDCYAKAEPDEPMFTLLARDPLAPFLVSIWASLRKGEWEAAGAKFDAIHGAMDRYFAEPDVAKASEALDCAMEMFAWAKEHPDRRPAAPSATVAPAGEVA